jgi:hypothetical protein
LKGISNDENSTESDDDNAEDTITDDDANITNDDDEGFSDEFQVAMTEKDDIIELTDYLQPLIAKLRTVVKLFRCSSTKIIKHSKNTQ